MPRFNNGEGTNHFLTYPGASSVIDAFVDFYVYQGGFPSDSTDAEAQKLLAVEHVVDGESRIRLDNFDKDYLLKQGNEIGRSIATEILELREL